MSGVIGFPASSPAPTLWDLAQAAPQPDGVAVSTGPPAPRLAPGPRTDTRFCVIASSSGGNASVLLTGDGRRRRVTLIDCGLSPRRIKLFLAERNLGIERIDDVVLTHLDRDHCHPGWAKVLPPHARFRIHRRHLGRAERTGLLRRKTEVFEDEPFTLATGVRLTPRHAAHDAQGVAVLRFEIPPMDGFAHGAALGYATDLGRISTPVVDLLRGVDVLAIESNYCPLMQARSARPEILKNRITGGAGHLSNEESAEAVRLIEPRRHIVLLHLSRECNSPALAERAHARTHCRITLAHHERPTDLLRL